MRVGHLHCAIMYSKWLHKCFFLSLKKRKKKLFSKKKKQPDIYCWGIVKKLACAIHSGVTTSNPNNGIPTALNKQERNLSGHKKIRMMVLPLGLCRFKHGCYIKTARTCNIGKKRLLKMTPLRSVLGWISWFVCFFQIFPLFILFFVLFFLHVAPPHYWCWLAVSRSNNMAEWFSKNTVAAVRLLGEVTLEEADSLRLCHRWRGRALTPARWPTPPEALAFLLCGDDTHTQTMSADVTKALFSHCLFTNVEHSLAPRTWCYNH